MSNPNDPQITEYLAQLRATVDCLIDQLENAISHGWDRDHLAQALFPLVRRLGKLTGPFCEGSHNPADHAGTLRRLVNGRDDGDLATRRNLRADLRRDFPVIAEAEVAP